MRLSTRFGPVNPSIDDSLLPSIFLPLHLLSFASLLGILATVFIIVVIFVDGFSKVRIRVVLGI
jgi:hypothetical protein